LIYWTLIVFFPAVILQPIPHSSLGDTVAFRLPLSIDLALHAAPAFTLLTDFVLFETKYSKRALANTPFIISMFAIWYASWVERCARGNNGICVFTRSRFGRCTSLIFNCALSPTVPYPFLTDNPFKYRLVIYTGTAVLAYSAFWTINRLHGQVRR
jgi:hypothetical protein